MPTPEEIVRLQLERSLSQDAIARNKKRKRLDNSILPTFMGENGKVRQLGQGESNALILPNLHYEKGEEMRPIVVRGGLMSVDNKSYFAPPVVQVEIEPPTPPPPTGIKFSVLLSVAINLYMFTGVSTSTNSPDQTTFIPYDQNNLIMLAEYQQAVIDFPPSGTLFIENIEVAPGIFVNVNFGQSSIGSIDGYPDPQQAYSITIECKSNYMVEFFAYLRQEQGSDSGFTYTPTVLAETWLANTFGNFELINTESDYQILVFGDPTTPVNLMPFTYSDGANFGSIFGCEDPETITYTFFVRYKNPSKTNWFEL